ncbi:MAG: C69 family dipeptidase [Chloroflexota bacterium]
MCFAVIVGRRASADGAVLFGHNEQNTEWNTINYRRIPRLTYPHGIRLKNGGLVTEIRDSYAFLWTEMPTREFSDNCFNEWGVAVAGNGCPTREDDAEALTARGLISEGGIGYMLPRLIAMGARTAREGVELAGRLIGRFGYVATGRSLTIADPNEAWVMSIARGRSWIARRVPDDGVVIIPNVHVIDAVDLEDQDNVIHSPGLVEYAVSRGWYDPAGGRPFSFRAAFSAPPVSTEMQYRHGCDSRQWHGQALITGQHAELTDRTELPFAVRPQRKLTVADVAAVLRSHLDGTDYDWRRQSPHRSPHHPEEGIDHSFAREACNIATQESVVFQLRGWLPAAIGCVAWRANAVPCTSIYTPWYQGIDETPPTFHRACDIETQLDLTHHFGQDLDYYRQRRDLAFHPFHRLAMLADRDYDRRLAVIAPLRDKFETTGYALQTAVEQTAEALQAKDPGLMRAYLTDYTAGRALQAGALASELVARFEAEER